MTCRVSSVCVLKQVTSLVYPPVRRPELIVKSQMIQTPMFNCLHFERKVDIWLLSMKMWAEEIDDCLSLAFMKVYTRHHACVLLYSQVLLPCTHHKPRLVISHLPICFYLFWNETCVVNLPLIIPQNLCNFLPDERTL